MTGASDHDLWTALPEKMRSWKVKGGCTKPSRWFSWNEAAAENLSEFTASRMVLVWYLGSEQGPDDINQPQLCFKEAAGLKLAYLGHSWVTWENAHIIARLQEPCWDYYSAQLHNIKTVEDGLTETKFMSIGWNQHWSLRGIAAIMVSEEHWDDLLFWVQEPETFITKVMDYGFEMLANRCATFSKYGSPPECYTQVLSGPSPHAINAMKLMKTDWLCLQSLECSGAPKARMLSADLRLTFDPCMHYTALQFQSVGWRLNYQAGLDLLRFLTATFPDSKIVEDCHQLLRTATGPKAHQKLTGTCIQQLLTNSDILECRDMAHPAKLSREKFLRYWHKAKDDFRANPEFVAAHHKLPKEMSKVLAAKTWDTISEQQLVVSAAAWSFLRYYSQNNLSTQNVKLKAWGESAK